MRWPIPATIALVALSLAAPAFGASPTDRDDCKQQDDLERRLAGCTRVLDDRGVGPRDRAIAYNRRGTALRNKGDIDRAIADFTAAIKLDPKFAFSYRNRGLALRSKGDVDRAIADYTEAINRAPKFAAAYTSRGFALLDKRDTGRAMADCNEAIGIAPKLAAGYGCRGETWRIKGDNDRALADCNAAIDIDAKYAEGYNCRALVWSNKGDHDRAIADYTEAIKMAPKFVYAYNNRGRAYASKGEHDRAIADYTEAIRLNPKYRAAYHNRGTAWSIKGDNARATADYSEAARLNPKKEANAVVANAVARTGGSPDAAAVPVPQSKSAPVALQTGIGRRVALVIGNSAYTAVAALPNPERDANAVAATLRSVGFTNVIVRSNATRRQLIDTLKSFEDEVAKSDWAVVYYAGHGIEIGGINYLIPVDAKLKDDRDVQDEAVPLERVLSSVESANKLRLVILDACRDNPFIAQMRRATATRSISRGLGSVEPEGGVLVAYAAKHGQVALDGDGASSPFASALVKRLTTPNLEISMLFRMVRDDVLNATGKRQEPFVYGSLPGESLYFVHR